MSPSPPHSASPLKPSSWLKEPASVAGGVIEPPTFAFLVEAELNGVRVDTFLTYHLRNYTSWRLQRIARAGGVDINDALATQTDRVFAGQQVRIRLLEPPDKILDPQEMDLSILYSDPWMWLVNKPAGVIVHPTGETQSSTLANGLQHLIDQQAPLRGLLRPGIVHRLDRQTSGVMAVALTHQAHAGLSGAFEASRVKKTYLALVHGAVRDPHGVMDWPIGRAPGARHVLMSCRADALDRKPARTQYEVVRRYPNHTLVLAHPRTGRNHQIRVHFARLGHPLVGDEFYEAGDRFKPIYADLAPEDRPEIETGLPIRRHALHALRLELAHPITGRWLVCTAPLREDFHQTLQALQPTALPDLANQIERRPNASGNETSPALPDHDSLEST